MTSNLQKTQIAHGLQSLRSAMASAQKRRDEFAQAGLSQEKWREAVLRRVKTAKLA